jgi:aryl-alcohol dehydrogenase-like predicted oxidoreductase
VQRFGLGTWQLAGTSQFGGRANGWGELDETQARALLHAALDLGVRRFDTSDAYGHGLSEQRLGAVLAGRKDCEVITKFGQRDIHGKATTDFSPPWIREAVDHSLRRLQRDRLDVCLMHNPPDDFSFTDEHRQLLESLQTLGKVGRFGLSARSVVSAENMLQSGFGSALEILYSALDRRAESVVAKAFQANCFVIARGVLGSGWLARSSASPVVAPDDSSDHRSNMPSDARMWLIEQDRNLTFLDELPGGKAVSLLRFALANPHISCVLLGARHPWQLQALSGAQALGSLDEKSCARIRLAIPKVFAAWA